VTRMSSSAPNGTDRPRQAPEGRGHDLALAQGPADMTGRRDRIPPIAHDDRAPESESASSTCGPGRRSKSSAEGKRVLNVGGVLCLSVAVCRVMAELFERIGWRHAADVAAGLFGLLAYIGFPAIAVYIVVKVVRGEIQW